MPIAAQVIEQLVTVSADRRQPVPFRIHAYDTENPDATISWRIHVFTGDPEVAPSSGSFRSGGNQRFTVAVPGANVWTPRYYRGTVVVRSSSGAKPVEVKFVLTVLPSEPRAGTGVVLKPPPPTGNRWANPWWTQYIPGYGPPPVPAPDRPAEPVE